MRQTRSNSFLLLIASVITLAVLVYGQVFRHQFLNYDDDRYIFQNLHLVGGFSPKAIAWLFQADLLFNSPNADYWQPVNFLSHLAVIQCFGLNPAAHHIANLILHCINSILIFIIFYSSTKAYWRSAILSLLFVVHPVQTEVVAWLSARKDLLSTFFALCTFWSYQNWVHEKKRSHFVLSFFCMIASLLSKPMFVTLPALLIIFDFWPLRRFQNFKIGMLWWRVVEKWPYVVLSASYLLVTMFARSTMLMSSSFSGENIQFAAGLYNFGYYLRALLIPGDFPIALPTAEGMTLTAQSAGGLLALVLLSWALLKKNTYPYLIFGLLFFVVGIGPVLLVPPQSRFLYLPMIGIMCVMTWLCADLFLRYQIRSGLIKALTFSIILTLSAISFRLTHYWRNNFSLFKHTADIRPNHYAALTSLASIYAARGETDRAISLCHEALQVKPDYAPAHHSLAILKRNAGELSEAEAEFRETIRLAPAFAESYVNYGELLELSGSDQEAINQYLTAVRIENDSPHVHEKIARLLLKYGKVDLAQFHLDQAHRFSDHSK